VIEVSEGYARNFLFPQHAGIQASAQALAELATRKKQGETREKKELAKARKLATDLDGMLVTIEAKVNEKGKLFAAISSKDIVKALKKKEIVIEADWVRFAGPIKEAGEYLIKLELPHGLEAELNLTVEAGA